MTHDVLLTEDDLAARWQISNSTLRHWRSQAKGPPFIKLPTGTVRYRQADIQAYEQANITDGKN